MALLPTASSIVDYLKGKGFKPSAGERIPLFEQRKSIYNTLGLDKQLGEFRGTAIQNPALVQALSKAEKTAGVSLNPQNLQSIISIARGGAQPATTPTAVVTAPAQPISAPQDIVPTAEELFQARPVAPERPPELPPTPLPSQEPQPSPFTGSDIQARALELIRQPSADELAQQALEKVTGSATFPLEQEALGAEKAKIQLEAERDKKKFLSQIASRGLFFSGKRQTGTEEIEADKISKLLNVDRNFGLLIAKGLQSAAQEVAKEAQQGSQNALKALETLGFGINPLTGGVEPTLQARQVESQERQRQLQAQQFQQQEARREAESAQKELQFQQTQERLEGQAQAQQQRFEATQALAEARLAVSMAQNQAQMQIAQRRLEIAEQNATRLGAGISSVSNQLKQLELQQKLAELIPSEGQLINKQSGMPAKVPSEFADSVAAARTMVNRDIPAIQDLISKVDTGPVRAPVIRTSQALGTSRTEENQLTALIADLNSKLLNLRSGAAVTPQEYERLQPLLPRIENQPSLNKDNLKVFSKNLNTALKNKLDVRGLDIAGGVTKGKPSLDSFVK